MPPCSSGLMLHPEDSYQNFLLSSTVENVTKFSWPQNIKTQRQGKLHAGAQKASSKEVFLTIKLQLVKYLSHTNNNFQEV